MKKVLSTLTKACPPLGRGFMLLEVIVAIFVLLVGIGGVFAFIHQTTSSGTTLSNQLVASYLAQEGMEIVRNLRDTNYVRIAGGGGGSWNDGLTGCELGCEADYDDASLASVGGPLQFLRVESDTAGTRYQYGSGTPTLFTREIVITPDGADRLVISIVVAWQERGRSHEVAFATELYNWSGF